MILPRPLIILLEITMARLVRVGGIVKDASLVGCDGCLHFGETLQVLPADPEVLVAVGTLVFVLEADRVARNDRQYSETREEKEREKRKRY